MLNPVDFFRSMAAATGVDAAKMPGYGLMSERARQQAEDAAQRAADFEALSTTTTTPTLSWTASPIAAAPLAVTPGVPVVEESSSVGPLVVGALLLGGLGVGVYYGYKHFFSKKRGR